MNECGAGKYSASPSSSGCSASSLTCTNVAVRAMGILPNRADAMLPTKAPDTRTIAMPPRPGGVATAAIVSLSEFVTLSLHAEINVVEAYNYHQDAPRALPH